MTSGPNRPNRPWSDDELDRLMAMLSDGATRIEMAAQLGRTPDSIKHGRFRLTSEGRWTTAKSDGISS